ncbi:ABC transporter ATP-binding protein [Herbaspirillum sp. BH-1]|jgi:peptide/nickel transport system ATP-binding protein|uniref:Peptide/nickel transport system ATP-binding protein n=1 Tax=Herbaspirillum frisingense TaxID=92645 RepID=A0ABU1PG68_9BURK|nr:MULTISPECIES: ABC transporter ATP-binding protein [Herbaspirillum]MDR6584118.1 peptide/nickel transport system ATP-binding protein [Herbaspirillum frisingense]PLY57639.1 ABC transporter ATP-binding protein [Herbaspirillum sp. BH-1]
MAEQGKQSMVRLQDLRVSFKAPGKTIRAVSGVDLELAEGEVVALIGESGSGKSVTLRSIMRLHPEARTRIEGRLEVDGRDVLAMNGRELSALRGDAVAMIFQEPLLALDPVYTVGAQIVETIRRHRKVSATEARAQALALFEKVRIPSPERRLDAYPHEMSGGMRQRAMIALALSCSPKVLLADEPTTALDATVQIQILLLLRELQRELGLSIIFVTHDIGAAVEVADRIAVMYAGRIVEQGPAARLLTQPRHPYTMSLLQSRSHGAMQKGQRLQTIPGAPPDLANLPPGCAFAERCAHARPDCLSQQPPELKLDAQHAVRCLRAQELQFAA